MKWGRFLIMLAALAIGGVLVVNPAYAEGTIVIPRVGTLAAEFSRTISCQDEIGNDIELWAFNYSPLHEDYFQATGVSVTGGRIYAWVFWWPFGPGNPRTPDDVKVYIDSDSDGKAERVLSFQAFADAAQDNWCKTYLVFAKP